MSIPEAITLLLAVGGLSLSIYTSAHSAKKTAVETVEAEMRTLRGIITELREELARWKQRYQRLYNWAHTQGLDPDQAEVLDG